MTFAALATVTVTLGFIGLCIWVLWPSNKARLEQHGHIPLDTDPDDPSKETRS